ncbi:F-box/WD repeat-containing protein 10 [Galemys pyrenaicus]|uniref:F-box/WD repeat-containing protein 10 n=1 Tax=Galemys pyrenaicus TaxID=202257 RepID=A0A8J6DXI8_GALPY|nr:F-box/WD repeat-containing protein 10 [Galemys pyrenaicus]
MAELELIVPGPLPTISTHPQATLNPASDSAGPAEESMSSLGRPQGESGGQGSDSAEQGAPGGEGEEEIPCDFCLGASRVKAVKSCLTCMVNYCEEHLRPHQENSRLHSHQLTEPVKERDLRTCPTHHSSLVAFCCSDQQCICQECGQGEHKGHTLVSLDAARRDKEASAGAELRRTHSELEQKLTLNKNAITRLQANHKSVLVSVSEVKVVAEEQFGELFAAMRKAQADANSIKTHLEHRSAEMEKSKQELSRIAALSNTVLFLEEYCKFKNTEDSAFPSVYIGFKDKLSGIRKVIVDSTVHLVQLLQNYKEQLQEFAKEEEYDIKTQVSAIIERKYRTSKPDPTTRQQFLQYACDITFDPETAHKYLRLQEDNRKVTNTTPWEHPYPDLPSRFVHWRQVLSQQSLYLHRYYFEVEISGAGTYVGLTCKGIDRKGEDRNGCISGNNFSWSLYWNGKAFIAWHSDSETPLKTSPFRRLGIYIDFQGGGLSFYGVAPDAMTLVHKFDCKFSEPVYPAFWLSKKENSIRIVDLGEEPEQLGPTPVTTAGPTPAPTPTPTSIMENLDSRLRNAPCFHCEKGNDSVPVCQKCETCILAWKIFSTKEWFRRISEISQRRFLVSILMQLDNLYLLHYFQNILQPTQGKEFIYSHSRFILSKKEGKVVKSSLNQMLDKTVEEKMKDILYWFRKSTYRTKAHYTLLLLQMCNPKLLLTAANVIRILCLRERNNISERYYNPKFDMSSNSFAARARQTSFPLSTISGKENLFGNFGGEQPDTEEPWKKSLQCISKMNMLSDGKAYKVKAGYAHSNLLVDMDAVSVLSSGISKYRDFIRYLPIHLSKYILSMLDKSSLNKCAFVSQHWAALAQQVKMDIPMHTFIHNQITFLQGSYTKGIDPNFANKLSIPVPKIVDDGRRMRVKNQKWKLRTKTDYNLWTAYQGQETQQVQTEERNVFCGTYNVRILSDKWDPNRVIHYCGGDLVAVSSNRRIKLLDIIQIKEIPIEFRGHAGSVHALFLCEEEKFLLSGSYDLSIRYWDLKSGACVRIFTGHQGTITCMDLYKKIFVSGAKDCQIKEWDLDTGKCLKTFKHKDPILAIRINDTYIVSSCERGIVKVWHIVNTQLVKSLTGHEGAVKCLYFDQWHLLSGGVDGLVIGWSMVGKYERCLMAFKHPKEVLHVALLFLRVISACADGKIRIYNFLNGNCLKVMKVNGRGDPVLSFFFQGNRMVINTESNILMFQFENIKWQYSLDRTKQKKKDKEEDREENGLIDIPSKASVQVLSLKESMSSKQILTLDSLLSKPHKSHILLRTFKVPSALIEESQSQGKLKSSRRDKKSPVSKEATGLDAAMEKQRQLNLPVDLVDYPKKKSWQVPMSPDRFLLTVNALQQAHNSEKFAYPCTRRPQTQVIDAWGPSISHPRKVLSVKGKSVQHEVDRLRISNPPIDVKQTNTPLEIQKLQPNLKNSLQSPQVQSTIPQPVIIRSRFSGNLKGEDGATSSVDGTVRSFNPLTSMQVIKTNRMLAPPVGTKVQTVRKEWPRNCMALNPFRMNTEFMLLTVKEETEYREAKMKEYQAAKPTEVISPEKASRAAWIRKIKGLSIDNFMKQGKIAAPELGQNIFI